MARARRARAPLTYRAYRFPHRRGRLTRRWSAAPTQLAGAVAVLTGLVLTFGVLMSTMVLTAYAYVSSDLPAAQDLKSVPLPLSSYLYDRTGTKLLYVLEDERRELAKLEEIPLVMQNATIAIEDKTFWSNPGIDPGGIMRASLENLRTGVVTQGASTITQQLVKMRLVGDEKTLMRKVREALVAMEVARMYSKEEILEMYFNQIYYGNQSYGVKAAAKTYFGVTDLSKLTLGQAALLAGLPQLPSEYDPVVNPEAAYARRQDVLSAMVELSFISREEAQAAAAEPIKVTPAQTPILYPHFVFRAREQLADFLGSDSAAYTGGYRVYTTLDVGLQDIAERDVRNRVAALRGANVNNAAMISMDPRNGQILAYVGSVDYNNNSAKVKGDFDVAGLGERQMGSSFKLFTYLAALRKGFTASTVLWDVSTSFGTYAGREYRPHNAPNLANGRSEENGPLTIRQALRESLNIPAIKVTSLVGVDAVIETVHALGLTRDWDRSQIGLSFGIGAGEMTLREITSAYQVVANMGKRVEPTMLLKVVDRDGNVVKDWSQPEAREVLSPQVAWVMTDILKDMTDPNGSRIFGSWTHIGRPAALKTGTTDDIRDVLAIGYVPQLLTAVWMGNSDNSEMFGISSAMGPGVLWKEYMQHAIDHLKLPPAWYDRPAGIVERVVCAKPGIFGGSGSGLLPSPACPGGWRITEKFIAGTEPKTDDRGFFGSGCVQPRAERPEWNADIVRWARAGRNARLGLGICGVSASPSPSPSASPPPAQPSGPPPRPQETPKPDPTKKP